MLLTVPPLMCLTKCLCASPFSLQGVLHRSDRRTYAVFEVLEGVLQLQQARVVRWIKCQRLASSVRNAELHVLDISAGRVPLRGG